MDEPLFTILLPVVRPPDLLPFAVASVQAQSESRFELMIISDGAPRETLAAARRMAVADHRIRVFDFPKGERHGEAHRHTVLEQARGRFVCQIGDDDQWLPNHLTEMGLLLEKVGFGNLTHATVEADGTLSSTAGDLSLEGLRRLMCEKDFNLFGPSAAGYRLEAYRALAVGWSPAPEGLWTDLAMWRKFLAAPGITAGTRQSVTSVHFAASLRRDWPMERRVAEAAHYAALIATPAGQDAIRQAVTSAIVTRFWASRAQEVALAERVGTLQQRVVSLEAEITMLKSGSSPP
ncbi:glycosyltransferase family 2 protein [Caulobacter henricii]|uniref:Glycosyltransferase 2-like domain-containing protein n=1 Tax=Caulobacter henricii TaxID=69395 RepID=A0A0P0P194_9CAUL|nr:glycosyltransferase family 2 protein [Caulobacter henricii]ALL14045.1 hypothetical protein AQ619_12220 [Caulobacter henricii]